MIAVRRGLAGIWWFLRELSGESAYDKYLTHHRQHHPDAPVLTRREFEALKTKPTVRCC